MEYTAQEVEKKIYKQASVGTHTGVCFLIADIGTQEETYEGLITQKRKLYFGWELPEELTDDGKPIIVYKDYLLSFNEKSNLLKVYKSWTKEQNPQKFNLDQFLGMGCNLTIAHTSGGNAKVTGVSALKASEKVPFLVNEPVLYDLAAPSNDALSRLPNFIKEKITNSPEFKVLVLGGSAPSDAPLDDEIPF